MTSIKDLIKEKVITRYVIIVNSELRPVGIVSVLRTRNRCCIWRCSYRVAAVSTRCVVLMAGFGH